MNRSGIVHEGIITSLTEREVNIRLILAGDTGDCGGCALSAVCRSDKGGINVTAQLPDDVPSEDSLVGRKVLIEASESYGVRATLLLLLLPLVLFTGVAIALCETGTSEWLAALAGLAAGAAAYIAVRAAEKRKKAEVHWSIARIY